MTDLSDWERAGRYALVDLHLHLDGSVSPELAFELARQNGISLPVNSLDRLASRMKADTDCNDLNQYLSCFDVVLPILQTSAALRAAARDLAERLSKQGLFYAEIRFAPQLHQKRGLSQEEAVEAVLDGLFQAARNNVPRFRLLLCCMRGGATEANRQTVRCAKRYFAYGVAGLDLAGAEAAFPTNEYRELFCQAAEWNIPFTLHAGEAAGGESVRDAISFGAARIGHGVRAREDAAVMALLREKGIALELCPSSNLQTRAVFSWKEYPLHDFLQQGIHATVNSDNMTVSDTTVRREFARLFGEYQLTETEARQLVRNAANAAFLPEQDRKQLLFSLEQVWGENGLS